MTVRGLPGEVFHGKVDRAEPPVGYTTRSLEVRLRFRTENPGISQSLFAHVSTLGLSRHNLLVVPRDAVIRTGAPQCQRELAQRAQGFGEEFLFHTQTVELRDIQRENTALEDAEAPIFTESCSLVEAMKKAGLARPDDVDPQQPWC